MLIQQAELGHLHCNKHATGGMSDQVTTPLVLLCDEASISVKYALKTTFNRLSAMGITWRKGKINFLRANLKGVMSPKSSFFSENKQ